MSGDLDFILSSREVLEQGGANNRLVCHKEYSGSRHRPWNGGVGQLESGTPVAAVVVIRETDSDELIWSKELAARVESGGI